MSNSVFMSTSSLSSIRIAIPFLLLPICLVNLCSLFYCGILLPLTVQFLFHTNFIYLFIFGICALIFMIVLECPIQFVAFITLFICLVIVSFFEWVTFHKKNILFTLFELLRFHINMVWFFLFLFGGQGS